MSIALDVAKRSGQDIPVGALVVLDGEILASSCNRVVKDNNPVAHAEMLVMQKASEILGTRILDRCEIYTTLEPCPMCFYAISLARFKSLYFGAYDAKRGAISCGHLSKPGYFFLPKIYDGIMEKESAAILKKFFVKLRSGFAQ